MERRALVALLTSLKMTKAWPLIFRLRETRISRIWPNWEKMAYRDFFSSAAGEGKRRGDWRPWGWGLLSQRTCSPEGSHDRAPSLVRAGHPSRARNTHRSREAARWSCASLEEVDKECAVNAQ